MSWFGGKSSHHDADATTFWPVSSYNSGAGALTDHDTEWACTSNKGFQTETKTFYTVLEDGTWVMVQVIWSFLGIMLVPATAQMTFKIYNPKTRKQTWKSVNAKGFKADKQSCKCDVFELKHTGTADGEEAYHITAMLDKDVQINITFTKPASALGFKYGTGEEGGFSSFGYDREVDKRDGFVVHRFHPLVHTTGTLIVNGAAVDATGNGIFIHAIQGGMRPNLIATRWNFAYFTTAPGADDPELGAVRAVQMEFTTTDDYGPKGKNSGRTKCNVGGVYASSVPTSQLLVVGETHAPAGSTVYPKPNSDVSSAEHLSVAKDNDTGYDAPHGLSFAWAGQGSQGKAVKATCHMDDVWSNLIEKVDVLAEIPYVLRKGLAAVTGTKPYIFQYHTEATLNVEVDGKTIPVKGWMFNEASFISM